MADDENDDLEEEEEQSSGPGKLVLALGALLLLIVGGGGGVLITNLRGGDTVAETSEATNTDGSTVPDTIITDLGTFSVNLRDAGAGRILQMKISIETGKELSTRVEGRKPQLRDTVLMLASDYTYQELNGIDGRMSFRDEIHAELNAVLTPDVVERVYFTDFVVQ